MTRSDPSTPPSFLVVEDNELICRNIGLLLEALGCTATLCSNGISALEELERQRFDGIVTDLNMPEMDGLTLIKELRQRQISTPVIVSTSFNDPYNVREASRYGISAFLNKPWSIEEFNESVRFVMDQRSATPSSSATDDGLVQVIENDTDTIGVLIAIGLPRMSEISKESDRDWLNAIVEICRSFLPASSVVTHENHRYALCSISQPAVESERRSVIDPKVTHFIFSVQRELASQFEMSSVDLPWAAVTGVAIRDSIAQVGFSQTCLDLQSLFRSANASTQRESSTCYDLVASAIELKLPTRLAASLRSRPEEFSTVWQPIVHLIDGRVTGAEALLRWNCSKFGPISPETTVATASRWGLMHQLGWMMRDQALSQAGEALAAMGPSSTISMNVESSELAHNCFSSKFRSKLKQYGVREDQVILEITESERVPASEATSKTIRELRAAGVRFSVDDFGTGFSNIRSLIDLPISEVKLDRSFLQDFSRFSRATEAEIALSSAAQIANCLGLPTVAEGIETETELEIARTLGVTLGQGYFWSRPQSLPDFLAWLRKREHQKRLRA